ncbi:JAB domain-containing protein [Halanaerobium salsuginis]|jgi:DNA repair protein RadC|uniref:DNA repair protein RadC n=1 Tax=Halanaerobium salsuginis TaxID=29563 RepID=A0A1I4MQL9_9FIRM|nr:JAB domain-containing protein [Halanaerobium salsuginis]SFM05367.1 DNA repair protein RadC [Halanaerobium salsuginis]
MKKVSIKLVKEAELDYGVDRLTSPADAARVVRKYIGDADRKMFIVICLDIKNQLNSINTVSIGTLTSSLSHPREIFKTAILSAAAILIAHNHPSGIPDPSRDDISITKKVEKAGDILGIELLDHIIIGDSTFHSMKEHSDF